MDPKETGIFKEIFEKDHYIKKTLISYRKTKRPRIADFYENYGFIEEVSPVLDFPKDIFNGINI